MTWRGSGRQTEVDLGGPPTLSWGADPIEITTKIFVLRRLLFRFDIETGEVGFGNGLDLERRLFGTFSSKCGTRDTLGTMDTHNRYYNTVTR